MQSDQFNAANQMEAERINAANLMQSNQFNASGQMGSDQYNLHLISCSLICLILLIGCKQINLMPYKEE